MQEPRVTIDQGALKGITSTDWKGGKYLSFLGIPYGTPPVGPLRFKPPKPHTGWQGERDCSEEGNPCYSRHMLFSHIIGSEDCLYLNVFTPKLPIGGDSGLLPVMVFIHGGGFTEGSSSREMYGPDYIITKNVVLVSINYRLGALGFLSLEDSSLGVAGNAGLKDMVLALKWVQKNIKHFGGQAENVTIFGESAGSAAVQYLMLSPMAKGLFHKAILQSGSVMNPWASGRQSAKDLAANIGLKSQDEREVLDFLMKQPVDKILEGQLAEHDPVQPYHLRAFGPTVERPPLNEDSFLTENPIDLIISGRYNKVPIMIGYNSSEGMFMDIMNMRMYGEHRDVTDFEAVIPHLLKVQPGSSQSKVLADKIKQFYYGDETASEENISKYYDLMSDTLFVKGIYDTLINHLKHNGVAYFYKFSADLELNVKKFLGLTAPGCCHADDLAFLFKNTLNEIKPSSADEKVIDHATTLWTNFAKTGNPTPKSTDSVLKVCWEPASLNKITFLDIDEELSVGTDPDIERMRFWGDIYKCSTITCKL